MDLKWHWGKVVNQENERLVSIRSQSMQRWVCISTIYLCDANASKSHQLSGQTIYIRPDAMLSLCNGHTKNICIYIYIIQDAISFITH